MSRTHFAEHAPARAPPWWARLLGARRGSWKGGCVGCGYDMRPEEAPKETLMRMQRERRFR